MDNAKEIQSWIPLESVKEPFRSRLKALFDEIPSTANPPPHFQLGKRVVTGNSVYLWVSGQVPRIDGAIRYQGVVGLDISVEGARSAARLSLLNLLCIIAAACDGDLSRVSSFVRMTGYVRSASDFSEHARVIDAASEIINIAFGEKGMHVRTAIGVSSLPGNASVELECVVQLTE